VQLLAQDAGNLVGPAPAGKGTTSFTGRLGLILRGCHSCSACKSDRAMTSACASGKPRGSVSGHFGPSQAEPPLQ